MLLLESATSIIRSIIILSFIFNVIARRLLCNALTLLILETLMRWFSSQAAPSGKMVSWQDYLY